MLIAQGTGLTFLQPELTSALLYALACICCCILLLLFLQEAQTGHGMRPCPGKACQHLPACRMFTLTEKSLIIVPLLCYARRARGLKRHPLGWLQEDHKYQ